MVDAARKDGGGAVAENIAPSEGRGVNKKRRKRGSVSDRDANQYQDDETGIDENLSMFKDAPLLAFWEARTKSRTCARDVERR